MRGRRIIQLTMVAALVLSVASPAAAGPKAGGRHITWVSSPPSPAVKRSATASTASPSWSAARGATVRPGLPCASPDWT
jgi:hypothetical protein